MEKAYLKLGEIPFAVDCIPKEEVKRGYVSSLDWSLSGVSQVCVKATSLTRKLIVESQGSVEELKE